VRRRREARRSTAQARREVELEDALREQLSNRRGAERGEEPRDGAHGEELGALRAADLAREAP